MRLCYKNGHLVQNHFIESPKRNPTIDKCFQTSSLSFIYRVILCFIFKSLPFNFCMAVPKAFVLSGQLG